MKNHSGDFFSPSLCNNNTLYSAIELSAAAAALNSATSGWTLHVPASAAAAASARTDGQTCTHACRRVC